MSLFLWIDLLCLLAGVVPLAFAIVTRRRFSTFWGLWCILAFVLFWLLLIPVTYGG